MARFEDNSRTKDRQVDDEDRRAMCWGKETFQTPALAWKVLRRKLRKKSGEHMEAYKCPACGLFHIGVRHSGPKVRKRLTATR